MNIKYSYIHHRFSQKDIGFDTFSLANVLEPMAEKGYVLINTVVIPLPATVYLPACTEVQYIFMKREYPVEKDVGS